LSIFIGFVPSHNHTITIVSSSHHHLTAKNKKNKKKTHTHHTKHQQFLTVKVGDSRIAIVHGDAHSLSGWSFALECMEPVDQELVNSMTCGRNTSSSLSCSGGGELSTGTTTSSTSKSVGPPITKYDDVLRWLEEANVDGFACTHTCLPFAQHFDASSKIQSSSSSSGGSGGGGRSGVVVNNGSAGTPNFKGARGVGLITRIEALQGDGTRFDTEKDIPRGSIYGTTIDNKLRIDAIAIEYDHEKWVERFSRNWPENSPAHISYFQRINQGTDLTLGQAARNGFKISK
jgi:hypothetical protein